MCALLLPLFSSSRLCLAAKSFSSPCPQAVRVLILFLWAAGAPSPAQTERVPQEYLEIRYAMGRGEFAEAHARSRALFNQKTVYPPLYETTAYLYVYEKRFAAGHTFFDSLLNAGHDSGNVAGAHAILWQTQRQPDSSLQCARRAVLQNSACVYPYEIFVEKSFELKKSKAAFELLRQQRQRHPQNWRLAFAQAFWHSRQGEYAAACDTLRALLNKDIKDWRIYYTLGHNLGYLEAWQEARKIYQQGISYCENRQDEEALVRLSYGHAQAARRLGQSQEASAILQQAFEHARRVGNRVWEGRVLLLLGQTRLQQHQWLEAQQTFINAAQRAQQYAEGELLLHAYDYLSELSLERGRRSEAVNYTYKAFEIADSLGMRQYAASLLIDLALGELNSGRAAQALVQMQKAAAYVLNQNLDSYLSFCYQNLASILNLMKRYPEALSYCDQAYRLSERGSNFEQLLKLKLLRGEILMHLGLARQARALLSQAASAAQNANLMTPFMHAQILLAQMEMRAQRYARAKAQLAHALASAPETPAYETNLKIMALLADIAWRTGQRAEAFKIYEDAAKTVVTQTHRLGPEHLAALSGAERELFFNLSRALMETGDIERALAETERARDLVVKRRHWQARQLLAAPAGSPQIRRLATLDSLLQMARVQKAGVESAQLQFGLAAKIAAWEREQTVLLQKVFGTDGKPWLDAVPFPVKNFKRHLGLRNEIALSFFVGDSTTLIFCLTADTLQAASLAMSRHELERQLLRIHQRMSISDTGALAQDMAGLDTVAAAGLYRRLLQDFLAGRAETALALVPDGILHALPFEILPLAPEGKDRPFFLVERFAVRYGSTLADLQQYENDYLRVKSFLLAAAPELETMPGNALTTRKSGRAPLATVGKLEARGIRALVSCKTFLTGRDLKRSTVLPALRRSDWLHVASHCYWQPTEPLFGEILLSIPPDSSRPERLFAFEIFRMALPVQMAVLSGCETVRGTFVESEGFEGFVQAFRAAGTPSIIASLWRVDDYASAEFFKAYYEALHAGQSTVRALQTAKIKMLHHGNYDFTDWAAFAYYGRDWRVELPRPVPFTGRLLTALGAALLLASGMLAWRWWRKSTR